MKDMHYDHSLVEELEKFIALCRSYDELYIYGEAHNQKMLAKYLSICGITVKGFVISDTLNKYNFGANAAVILGLSDKYYNEVIPSISKQTNLIFLTERAKREISYKVSPRKPEEYHIEINLADHCNLNCQMCDHFSQLVKEPHFPDIVEFERDIKRLSELTGGKLYFVSLCGGEPLLNRQAGDYLRIVRKYFKETPIHVYTNGLLLLSRETDSFWVACKEEEIAVYITPYPIKLDINAINRKAIDFGVRLSLFEHSFTFQSNKKYSYYYKMNRERSAKQYDFVDCYQMNNCLVLRNGKIYTCPTSAYIDYFNNYFDEHFKITKADFIDIHKACSFDDIAEFMSKPVPFCGYCDIKGREYRPWKRSDRSIYEYVKE